SEYHSDGADRIPGHRTAEALSGAEPGRRRGNKQLQLSSAYHGAIEHDDVWRALHAQPGRQCGTATDGTIWRHGRAARSSEPGTTAKREFKFQLEPCGIGPGEHIPATGRKARVGFLFTAGRIHRRLSPDDEYFRGQVEPEQQPDNKLLHQWPERCCCAGGHRAAQRRSIKLWTAEHYVKQSAGTNPGAAELFRCADHFIF